MATNTFNNNINTHKGVPYVIQPLHILKNKKEHRFFYVLYTKLIEKAEVLFQRISILFINVIIDDI